MSISYEFFTPSMVIFSLFWHHNLTVQWNVPHINTIRKNKVLNFKGRKHLLASTGSICNKFNYFNTISSLFPFFCNQHNESQAINVFFTVTLKANLLNLFTSFHLHIAFMLNDLTHILKRCFEIRYKSHTKKDKFTIKRWRGDHSE